MTVVPALRVKPEGSGSLRKRSTFARVLSYTALALGSLLVLLPFLWMLRAVAEPNDVLYATDGSSTIWPTSFTLDHLRQVWNGGITPFYVYFVNSVVVTLIVTVSNVVFCGMAGFALARGRFRGKNLIFAVVIIMLAMPVESRVLPLFAMLSRTPLVDTSFGIAVPLLITSTGIFLMRQYIMNIPREIDEAAYLDGCSMWSLYWRIIFPVSRPAVAVVAILSAVAAWNDFLWPLIVVTSNRSQTLPLAIANMASTKQEELIWGELLTASLMSLLPILILYLLLQRQFISGLTSGAVKG
jgi:multiple sugar transport system permease protein